MDSWYGKYMMSFLKTYGCMHGVHVFILIFVGQVLQQQTEAIARLGNVLKRDIRDMEIIMAEDTQRTEFMS